MALPLSYNWRNLFVRKLSTALTFTVVAVVVLVLAVLLSFAAGIRASLARTGSPGNVLVIKPGATSESTSFLLPEEVARLLQTPGLARGKDGRMLLSQEMYVQTSIPRRHNGGNMANVAVRGVDDTAFDVHEDVRILEGRRFRQGTLEIIVGRAARERYQNLRIGSEVGMGRLGDRKFRVVGVFEAGGGALESEIWAPRTILSDSYHRRFASSAALRLSGPEWVPAAVSYINGPTVQLEARRETDYYRELAAKTREIVVLTTILIAIMGVGAVFAVANTMYAAVDGRRREIAMLRTIGFNRRSIMLAFVIESLLVTTLACACGLAASLLVSGSRQDYLSDVTWTVLAYELRVTPGIAAAALAVSTLVGICGALAPAVRASRTRVIEALRKA